MTHPVGQLKANELGLYDMSGKVVEWCQDWWSEGYDGKPMITPRGAESGEIRVVRSGSWINDPDYTRVSRRLHTDPYDRQDNFGFRLAFQG